MNDYNNGALPDPCLRLDYGFGEEWASVELGDGTGYVRLADYEKLESDNAKLRAERDYLLINSNPTATELRRVRSAWKKDRDENAKLRELVRDYDNCLDTALYLAGNAGYPCMPNSGLFNSLHPRMRELGIKGD